MIDKQKLAELESALRGLLSGEFANLGLSFNDEASCYKTVAKAAGNEGNGWVSEAEKQKAIAENSHWKLQLQPYSPARISVSASSLTACTGHEAAELETALRGLLKGEFSSLALEFNCHAANRETAAQSIADGDDGWYRNADWVSEEEKAKAAETNSAWLLRWYPNTPVGNCCVAASSLAACIEGALS